MYVVVKGDFSNAQPQSIIIPINEPMLIIRDPPGGESTVSYSHVETTVKVSMENYEKYMGLDVSAELGVQLEAKAETCMGFLAAVCPEGVEGGGFVGGLVEHSSS